MITSLKNQRIKDAQKLTRKRYREQMGVLLLEGLRLVSDVVASGIQPQTVFHSPEMLAHTPSALAFVEQLCTAGVECIPCSAAVFATLANTVTPQGVAAIVPLPHLPLPRQATLTLILDQVRDPGNAGTLLRSAEAAGVDQVIFAPDTVDPLNDKVVRAAMGAHFRLPFRVCHNWDAVTQLLPPACHCYLAQAHAQRAYDLVDWQPPAALVVGGEASGASAAAINATIPISIPMQGDTESLNASIAGAIILFEAARQRRSTAL